MSSFSPTLTFIRLVDWRSHARWSGTLARRTILHGTNGSGKTNILDAISTLLNAEISGGHTVPSCIRDSATQSLITGDITLDERVLRCHTTIDPASRGVRTTLNGTPLTRPKYLEELPCRAIRFDPIEINALYLEPGLRRDFLDTTVGLAFPAFARVRADYTRALRHRNAYLKDIKDGRRPLADIAAWDTAFVTSAVRYYEMRMRYVAYIEERVESIASLLGRYELVFEYTTKVNRADVEGSIRTYLDTNRDRDVILGHTHIGPHVDDIKISVRTPSGLHPAVEYLSRGECKMLFLGLKMLQIGYVEIYTGTNTLLLLDDLGSELDDDHTARILDRCGDRQTIATIQTIPDYLASWRDFERIYIA